MRDSDDSALPENPKPGTIRHENRVAAMQFLYSCEANPPDDLVSAMRTFFENQERPREFYPFAEELAWGAWEEREGIDRIIESHLVNWKLSRIARVDLAILRLAIYELMHRRDIPPVVSINEAIDLAKEFSTPESKRFINGLLDKLKGQLDRPLRTAAE